MSVEWLWDLVEIVLVNGASFAAWFLDELRDFDLVKILEATAALGAIGFTIWRVWLRVVANPAKRLMRYIQERDGEISEQTKGLVADVSRFGARSAKPRNASRKFMDVDKNVRLAVKDFQSGSTETATKRLETLTADLDEKRTVARDVASLCDKDEATVHLLLGVMAYYDRDYTAAAEALNKSLALEQNQWQALKHLGLVEYREGNVTSAVERFNQLADSVGDETDWKAEAHRLLGYIYLHAGNKGKAADALTIAAEIEDKSGIPLNAARTHELLGDAHHALSNWKKAAESYGRSRRKYASERHSSESIRVQKKIDDLEENQRTSNGSWNEWLGLNQIILLHFEERGSAIA